MYMCIVYVYTSVLHSGKPLDLLDLFYTDQRYLYMYMYFHTQTVRCNINYIGDLPALRRSLSIDMHVGFVSGNILKTET